MLFFIALCLCLLVDISFLVLFVSLTLPPLILRIETVADQIPEAIIKSAMRLAHESVQRIIAGQVIKDVYCNKHSTTTLIRSF